MENLMKTFESQEFGKVRVVEISGGSLDGRQGYREGSRV